MDKPQYLERLRKIIVEDLSEWNDGSDKDAENIAQAQEAQTIDKLIAVANCRSGRVATFLIRAGMDDKLNTYEEHDIMNVMRQLDHDIQ